MRRDLSHIEQSAAAMGITLSKMQHAVGESMLLDTENIVVLSPTGSGKTLAYLLPLTELIDKANDNVQAIVIVPGRELAEQSADVLRSIKCGVRGYACHGGRPTMDEHRELRKVNPQIIFSTPGRLNDHLDKGNIIADDVRFIIIDEYDKCLEMGFADEMNRIIERMPQSARRIFLSATAVSSETQEKKHSEAQEQGYSEVLNLDGFKVLDYRETDSNDNRITIEVVRSPEKDKLPTLKKLLLSLGTASSIVFVNYRESVERIADYLTAEGFTVSAYHGGLDQRGREEALYRFANGSANILVSTNLGSRGLDIPNVENVIHYHLPETEEDYTHRTGRTARWDKTGHTLLILSGEAGTDGAEKLPDYIDANVEEVTLDNVPMDVPQPAMATIYIGKGKKDKVSKGDVVGFLCKTGGLKGSEIGRIDVYDYYAYAAVNRAKVRNVLRNVQGKKIKGLKTKFEVKD